MLPPVPSLPPPTLWGCFVNCLKRENYARLSGRSTRREYWSFLLFCGLISFIAGFLMSFGASLCAALFGRIGEFICLGSGISFILGFMLYTAMPGLAVYVRRLHDVGWSGWWIGLSFSLTAVCFGILWFELMLGVQEWMWMNENITWDAEMMQRFVAYLKMPRFPLLDTCRSITQLLSNILSIVLFILTLWPSQKEENRYGQKPLA